VKKFRAQKSARPGGNERLREILRSQNGFVPFTGELMNCVLCPAEERSDPEVCKGWRCWVIDGRDRFYICPSHIPPQGVANRQAAFADLYVRAFQAHVARTPGYQPAKRVTAWIEGHGAGAELN
jgi:hypothetical protein